MIHHLPRAALGVLFVAATLGLATHAHADEIASGDLYGVYANQGDFGGSTTYTIIHQVEFGPGLFPSPLEAASYPVETSTTPVPTGIAGAEFFLLGNLTGQPGSGDHFLISARDPVDPLDPSYPSQSVYWRYSELMAGVDALRDEFDGDGVITMNYSDFWALFDADDAEGFEAYFLELGNDLGRRPISRLDWVDPPDPATGDPGTGPLLSFAGSEDLFGYTSPDGPQLVGTMSGTPGDPQFTPVPEPASLALVLGGLVAGGALRRRRRRAA